MKRTVLAATAIVFASVWVSALPPGTEDDIASRIKPFGDLCRAGDDCGASLASADTAPLSGESVYDQFCFACHANGVGGAPTLGDTDAWAERIDKGMDELMASTMNGLNAMPAKGTCMNCTEAELEEAVTFMLDKVQ